MKKASLPARAAGTSSSGPWSSGELNTLIGDYGNRLIGSPPEARAAAVMELTEKWFDLHVRGCYEGLQTEEDRNRFLYGLDNNLPMWFWHSLTPILSKPNKSTAKRCLNVVLAKWRGKACSTPIAPVPQPASDADQIPQRDRSWDGFKILFMNEETVQISEPGKPAQNYDFGELGFADKRSGEANKAWKTLLGLAEGRGVLLETKRRAGPRVRRPSDYSVDDLTGPCWDEDGGGVPTQNQLRTDHIEKRMQELRRVLRAHFGINTNPIRYIKGEGYSTNFKIEVSPEMRSDLLDLDRKTRHNGRGSKS